MQNSAQDRLECKAIKEGCMMKNQEFLLQFAKEWTKKGKGVHYTLTPDHLYFHNKKKLHKSKIIWRFGMNESELTSSLSDDGGETWRLTLGDGFVLLNPSDIPG